MDTPLLSTFDVPLTLAPGRLLRLPGEGARLRVLAGGIWLTCRDEPTDHFLSAGDSLPLPPGSAALLEAEPRLAAGAAVVVIERCEAQPQARPSNWSAWLRWRPPSLARLR